MPQVHWLSDPDNIDGNMKEKIRKWVARHWRELRADVPATIDDGDLHAAMTSFFPKLPTAEEVMRSLGRDE
jgi:hypothetical protein